MKTIDLTGKWELIERPLGAGVEAYSEVQEAETDLPVHVPGDVNDALVQAGRMPEPLVGRNFEEFGWVQQRSWWYRKRFSVPPQVDARKRIELILNGLDVHADIWLNGVHLGHQSSAFYPFHMEVGDHLKAGRDNTLLVRVTTGRERVDNTSDFPMLEAVPTEEDRGYPERGFKGRVYLRKPAYVWGWDWAPSLPTCGITGEAELRVCGKAEIRNLDLRTESITNGAATVTARVELEWDTLVESAYGTVEFVLTDEDGCVHRSERDNVFFASGTNHVDLQMEVPDARLWWPNGSGDQHLYVAQVSAEIEGETADSPPMQFGIRTVEMDTSPGHFRFIINGVPIFLQGGNWIPCDSLYGRITKEKVTRLVEEAAEANFNCLRIWGGGRFEMDAFYDACDRLGILVWQDFMSACAPLPAHKDWFVDEFEREARYQIRRLRSRACLLLWCGNNEVGQIYEWFDGQFPGERDPGWKLYHRLLPRLTSNLSPHVPYWPTSPYGGKESVRDPDIGDDHHWVVMSPEKKFWADPFYWDSAERPLFNSEYGYGGPCCMESTRQYLDTDEPNLFDETGRQHTNSFYDIARVNWSIEEHYRDPSELDLEEYILFGGLCQGLNLGYSLESLRANHRSMGGIFWMYDDAWGENGWTIIDYYLRRKIAYYRVKRSLAPCRLVLRKGGDAFGGSSDDVVLIALNTTPQAIAGTVAFGFQQYDGSGGRLSERDIVAPPRSKTLVGSVPRPDDEGLDAGTIMAIPQDIPEVDPVVWKHCFFRELDLPSPDIQLQGTETRGGDLDVTLVSDVYAHAVHFHLAGDYRLSDHYFDLLPGIARTVRIVNGVDLEPDDIEANAVLPPTQP